MAKDKYVLDSSIWIEIHRNNRTVLEFVQAYRVAQKSFHPPLIDLYIAQASWENGKTLATQDKHFTQIAKIQPFPVILVEPTRNFPRFPSNKAACPYSQPPPLLALR